MFEISWRDAPGQTSKVKVVDHKTFDGFVASLLKTIEGHEKNKNLKKKHDATWFIRGPASRRSNADLQAANLIIGDVDDTSISPEACSQALTDQDITHFIYTTSSHTSKSPRYRIIVPYKASSDQRCKRATGYLQSLIPDIKLASESYTWAQEWYLPINGAEVYGHKGKNLKVPKTFEFESEENKESSEGGDSDVNQDYETHLRLLKEGNEIHPHSRAMCLALANGGLSAKMIFKVVWPEVLEQVTKRGISDVSVRMESTKALAESAVKKVKKEKKKVVEEEIQETKIDIDQEDEKQLPWPPGLMGELARAAHDFQRYQDKTLAIMTAFALVAGVAARRHNINELGLAIYVTMLADTGRGKDSIAKFINRTLIQASEKNGHNHIGAKSYTAAKSLMRTLKERPCIVSVITEAAFALKTQSGSPESLRKTILDVYTKTARFDVAVGEVYSDEKFNIPSVRAPNFTMINESTPKLFLEAMNEHDGAEAGDYGRMFVYRIAGKKPIENFDQRYKVGERVLKRLKTLINFNAEIAKDDDPQPNVIKRPKDYKKFSAYCTHQENKYRHTDGMKSVLFSRANEKRLRLIGLMCAMEGIDKPTDEIVSWATNAIAFEVEGLTKFNQGAGDSLERKAILSVGKHMYQALHDDKKGKRDKDTPLLRRNHIVSYGVLRRRAGYQCKQYDDEQRNIRGIDKMIKLLIAADLIVEIDVDHLADLGMTQARRSAYKMTNDLYREMKELYG